MAQLERVCVVSAFLQKACKKMVARGPDSKVHAVISLISIGLWMLLITVLEMRFNMVLQ